MDLYVKPADGSGEEKLLLKTNEQKYVDSWTPDGRFLLFYSDGLKTGADMWALPFPGEAKPVLLLRTQFQEGLSRVQYSAAAAVRPLWRRKSNSTTSGRLKAFTNLGR